jgi:hypothetical protein
MLMSKRITVSVPSDGQNVTVEVDGWIGPGCQKLTANLEAALGKVVSDELKEEFRQRSAIQDETVTQGQ